MKERKRSMKNKNCNFYKFKTSKMSFTAEKCYENETEDTAILRSHDFQTSSLSVISFLYVMSKNECALLHSVYKNFFWYQKSYSKIQYTCIWYHMRNTRYSIEHRIDIYETLQKLRTCKVRLISILISNASWGISRVYIWNRKQAVTEPGVWTLW